MKHKKTGKFLALKTLKKNEIIRLKQVEHILSEKQILGKIEHPFIVNLCAPPPRPPPSRPPAIIHQSWGLGGPTPEVAARNPSDQRSTGSGTAWAQFPTRGRLWLQTPAPSSRPPPLSRSPRLAPATQPPHQCRLCPCLWNAWNGR